MRSKSGILLFLLSLLLLTMAQAGIADEADDAMNMPEAPLNERVLSVPGDSYSPVSLQVTVYMPNGPGPFPLAIMNHGATSKVPPEQQPRYRITFAAYYFLSRGYAVALPMMRGYAGSEGRLVTHRCNYAATGLEAAVDVRAVIEYMKQQPGIDGSQIVVAGQSFGGWNTLALGALNVPNVKGLVSFSGAMEMPTCETSYASLLEGAQWLGAHTTTPSIWFFGDNDQLFSTRTWHGMYDRYTAAGGPAELVAYGTFQKDSHNMLGSGAGLPIWVPKVDAFLGKVGLPHRLIYPEYMPGAPPPPSHYANLDDTDALPYLTDPGRVLYQKFLELPLPRAFVISPTSGSSYSGGFDPRAQALKVCRQHGPNCQLYAVDNDVVWVRPTPAPPPTQFAALADQNAVPYLTDKGREGYQKFLTLRRPRAFVIAPDGAWYFAAVGVDPLARALSKCGELHHDCALYAVDGDVVWAKTVRASDPAHESVGVTR